MLNLKDILSRYKQPITVELEKIDGYLIKNLSSYRYEHSLKVLEYSLNLGRRENLEESLFEKLVIAALTHDITKEKPPEFHKRIFIQYNQSEYINLPPALYHSKSGEYFIKEEFNIQDKLISHAISYHSTGCEDMPLFSRIIFCADFLATFDAMTDSATFSNMLKYSLGDLCLEKARNTIGYLMSEKLPVQPESINFYNILIKESK